MAEKPFRVLEALLERPGEVVRRDTLRERLWPEDTFVDFDNNLNSAVATLRQVLGDRAREPRYIETLPRLGYRFIGPANPPPRAAVAGADRRRGLRAPAVWATAAVGLVAAGLIWLALSAGRSAEPPVSEHPQAREEFARGRFLRGLYRTGQRPAAVLGEARAAFQTAARHDPAFASAWAEDADTAVEMAFAGAADFRSAMREARDHADRALRLTDREASAHRAAGIAALFLDWKLDALANGVARARRLAPSDARNEIAYAMSLAALGRHDAAIRAAERAVELDAESYYVRADLAFFYLSSGDNVRAAVSSRRVLDVAPDFAPAHRYFSLASERLGRWQDAAASARTLMTLSGATAETITALAPLGPAETVRAWRQWELERLRANAGTDGANVDLDLALRHALAGDRDAAIESLGRAFERRASLLVLLRAFPELISLRGDPRFERLAASVTSGSHG